MKMLRKRLVLGVLAVALAAGVSLSAAPKEANAMMPACSDIMDCIHTAHWYYFLR
ncbi:hypothetical protein PAESOLCIP111_03073 [Paenibacillus solanacearum]|uniref:Uncharacterized protein n=1 Tax=Paenibacillus solanacearum TaxID=2048548 RepID=A0A916K5F3_9BACL|nr:hypothetical protein [Paenibacillus solanacearum]CAG7629136.1 hypothetical protein PAESOLCIP111_03073 [Paenibacillus solanacearum]